MRPAEITIVVPTIWDYSRGPCHLRMMLGSVEEYAPDAQLLVAARNVDAVRSKLDTKIDVVQQPDDARCSGAAWDFLLGLVTTPYVVLASDDTVWCPDTLSLLRDDWQAITEQRGEPGILGVRTDYAKGAQHIASGVPTGLCAEVPMVVPVAAMGRTAVICQVGGFPHGDWYADDLLGWRLRRAGRSCWVSRAYVHHLGEQSTGRDYDALAAQGQAWLASEEPLAFVELTGRPLPEEVSA